VIEYQSSNPNNPGVYHSIRVVVDQPRLTVRTRSGYYSAAPPQWHVCGCKESLL